METIQEKQTPTLTPVLSTYHSHDRDKYITFIEKDHTYIISFDPNVKYTSVTTWNHEYFSKFDADVIIQKMMNSKSWKPGHKYWGMTPDEIKTMWNNNSASVISAGTELHFQIECFHNQPSLQVGYSNLELYNLYKKDKASYTNSLEWQYFIKFIKDHTHLRPYRTEWCIFHEEAKLSGSIDMVYKNPDGTYSIYDWKRSKQIIRFNSFNVFANSPIICHLPDSNFWQYALQLNTYKFILESKYDIQIHSMFLVRMHPDAPEETYELIELPDLQNEIRELVEERIASFTQNPKTQNPKTQKH
jgi:hypothetical protein